jgi:hypothetical protein
MDICILDIDIDPDGDRWSCCMKVITSSAGNLQVPLSGTGSSGTGSVTAVRADPVSASTVYAGLDGPGVYRSTDRGGAWTQLTLPGSANTRIRALSLFRGPGSPATTVYAGSYGGGVYRSTDSGDTWTGCTNTGLANLNVLSLATNSTGGVYSGTENGIYASTDNCNTWTALNSGLP